MPDTQNNIQTVIQTTVDTSQAQTGIVNLRKEYQGAFSDVQQTTKGTQEYFAALQKAADARSQITELRREIKLLDPREQFQAVATSIKGLTGGFQAAQGAAILFSSKNKELEETLKQVLGGAQFFAGLQDFITGLRRSGDLIGLLSLKMQQNAVAGKAMAESNVVVTESLEGEAAAAETAEVATGGFNKVLAASAIGAILLLLPLFVSGMNDVSKSTKDADEAQKTLNDAHEKGIANLSEDYTQVQLLIQEYKNQNTTLAEKKKITDELQEDYPNYFGNLDTEHDKVGTLDNDYKKWSQSIILKAEADADAAVIQEKTQDLLKKQLDPSETLSFWQKAGAIISGVFGGVETIGEHAYDSAQSNLKELVGQTQKDIDTLTKDFISKTQQIDANGGDPSKQSKEKSPRETKVKGTNDNILKLFQEFYLQLRGQQLKANEDTQNDIANYEDTVEKKDLDGRAKELKEDQDAFDKAKEQVMLNGGDLEALEDAHRIRQAAINKKFDDQDATQKLDDAKKLSSQLLTDAQNYDAYILIDIKKTNAQKKAALDKELEDLKAQNKAKTLSDDDYTQAVQDNTDDQTALNDLRVRGESDAVKKIGVLIGTLSKAAAEGTETQKDLAIAAATISAYVTIANIINGFTKTTPVYGYILGIAEAAVAAVQLFENISKIEAVQIPGGSGGGSSVSSPSIGLSGGSIPSPTQIPTSTSVTTLDQNSISQINRNVQSAPVRAFVVERDVTNSQSQMQNYRNASTIGGNH